jgi:hypothetical protein
MAARERTERSLDGANLSALLTCVGVTTRLRSKTAAASLLPKSLQRLKAKIEEVPAVSSLEGKIKELETQLIAERSKSGRLQKRVQALEDSLDWYRSGRGCRQSMSLIRPHVEARLAALG